MPKVSDIHKRLYHYTTWDGLLGILHSQKLWASHYRFLNDFSEIILFKEKLITLLLPYVLNAYDRVLEDKPHFKEEIYQKGGPQLFAKHDIEVMVNASYETIGEEIYILSFCGENNNPYVNQNGLLSQWRGYGPGGGFALVFNTEKFEQVLGTETQSYEYSHLSLADIVYSDDHHKFSEELADDLQILANDTKLLFDHQNPPTEHTELQGYHPFITCIGRYKHCGFSEESEVRVIAIPTDIETIKEIGSTGSKLKPKKERKFRTKNGEQIPYIELLSSPSANLPIERIIVGPHKDKEARAAALRVMTRGLGIEISCSDIPFVG